ncbi:WD40 repeat domain-containing protein [Sphingobacterium pedocola]|uniref:WD40 repeat domain-containing protein n=1 Tax=Sphingobacterium pedocola TaxID=2082722 RepID=A0ABR9T3I9_9SPHI|nr:WD40 repeat domain-containing protein [Sphingobacterium pedocola]MBE8719924.1 WD40 repeat domain-containing protein [Sphingobacterium pedocola]
MSELLLKGTLTGHQNPIFALEGIPGKSLLFSGGNDKGVVEWDLKEMKFRRVLCTVPASVYTLYHIPQTNYLAVGMRNGEIYIVDFTKQELVAKLKVETGAVFCIKSLRGKQELIATGEEGKAYVWDLKNFELLYCFSVSKVTVRTFSILEDESRIAFGDKDGVIYVVDSLDYHCIERRQVHEGGITSLAYLNQDLYSGGRDAKLFQLNAHLETINQIIPHMFTVYGIAALAPSPKLVTVSRDKTIKIWSTALNLLRNVSKDRGYDSHMLSINSVYFDNGMQELATAGDDKLIKIWSVS